MSISRIFAHPAIVYQISEWVADDLYIRNLDDVRRFSYVCRAVRGPASDWWWHRQYSLYFVLRSFGDAVEYKRRAGKKPRFNLVRRLEASDWARFMRYASKIKILLNLGGEPFIVSEGLMHAWVERGLPLFPNLEQLDWPLEGVKGSFHPNLILPMFITPKLRYFYSTGENHDRFALPLLECIRDKKSPIDTFYLECTRTPETTAIWQVIFDRIKDNVQKLEGSLTTGENLAALTTSTKLWHLQVPLQFEDVDLDAVFSTTQNPFPALKHLFIHAADVLDLCSEFIMKNTWTGLEELNIVFNSPEDDDALNGPAVSNLTYAISQHIDPAHLKKLFCTSENPSDDWVEEAVVGPASLRPLLQFVNLETLDIDLSACYDLDDDFLAEIADAMPEIKHLNLGVRGRWPAGRRPQITLPGLLPLVSKCQELETLSVRVNAVDFVPLPTPQSPPRPNNRSVQLLTVGSSPISPQLVGGVAAFLEDVFPRLQFITADADDIYEDDLVAWGMEQYDSYEGLWEQVTDQVHAIQATHPSRYWYVYDTGGI